MKAQFNNTLLDKAIESIKAISLNQGEEIENLLSLVSDYAEQTTYQVSDLLGGLSVWLQKRDKDSSGVNTLVDLWKLYLDDMNEVDFSK